MSNITLRSTNTGNTTGGSTVTLKSAPLTNAEMDHNILNLNADKIQSGDTVAALTITSATINGGSINNTPIGGTTPARATFTYLNVTENTVPTNGLYLPSTNTLGIATNTTKRLEIDASGNVGIGKTPGGSYLLDVNGSAYFESNVTVHGNLTIDGATNTVNSTTLSIVDNLIYLNVAREATITNAVGDGTYVTYTANNNFVAGDRIRVTGMTPSQYDITLSDDKTVYSATSTEFVVFKTDTGTFSVGGTAYAKSNVNPDMGFAGGYYDTSYKHSGLFRDATDGIYKFFDGYTPEPDASVFIDTTHASFAYAQIMAYALRFPNNQIKIGEGAGLTSQGTTSIAIGYQAGRSSQGNSSVAVGYGAGQTSQGASSVAIGINAANNTQGINAVAIGNNTSPNNQKEGAVAIGSNISTLGTQEIGAIAIGMDAVGNGQLADSIAIGNQSAGAGQGEKAISIGVAANSGSPQGTGAIAIGAFACNDEVAGSFGNQAAGAIAIGRNAGGGGQDTNAIAIGNSASNGADLRVQAAESIAIGNGAGNGEFGPYVGAIAIGGGGDVGYEAGQYSIALGYGAGWSDTGPVGDYTIAIGYNAAWSEAGANCIVLNASGVDLSTPDNNKFLVKPVSATSSTSNLTAYNSTTGEISYSSAQIDTAGTLTATSLGISGAIEAGNGSSFGTTQITSLGVGTASSGTAGEIRATNNITAYYSDERLKTRLGNIENALDKVDALTGFYYEANETAQTLGYKPKREVGVSAQEVQAVLPEIVTTAPIDEKYLTIYYERLTPLLIEAIKELRREVNSLKQSINK